jgi:hypothetical protein
VAACWCAGRGSSRQASRGGAAAAKPALSRPIAQRGAASHLAHRGPRPRPLHASQQQRRSSVGSSCRKRAAGSAATAAACCSSCEQGHACRGPMLQWARPMGPGCCLHAQITALLCSAHATQPQQQHLGKGSTPSRASDGARQQRRRCAPCRTTHVWRIRSGRPSGRRSRPHLPLSLKHAYSPSDALDCTMHLCLMLLCCVAACLAVAAGAETLAARESPRCLHRRALPVLT